MTICIACLCERGKTLVVASDRMITAGFLAKEFEHDKSKIHKLSAGVVALTAGDATRAIEVFRAVESSISSKPDVSVRDVASLVSQEYEKLRNQKVTDNFFRPRGMTRESFYKEYAKLLPQEMALSLEKMLHQTNLGLTIIIAGVDDAGGHIFGITNPGNMECFDAIGYHSIGSGELHAFLSLIGKNTSIDDDLTQCIYKVYEAKRAAETAPGVGNLTDVAIVRQGGAYDLTGEDISILDDAFAKINKPRKSNIKEALKGLSILKKDERTSRGRKAQKQ